MRNIGSVRPRTTGSYRKKNPYYVSKPKTIFQQCDEQQAKRVATASEGPRKHRKTLHNDMNDREEAVVPEEKREERSNERKLMIQLYRIRSKFVAKT